MCTAAGVGPRTEKSGKETTSPGMSSLPTSAGSNHLAHPSGQSPEIGDPEGSAHSDSASACPAKPSDPDSIELKAFKAAAEFQITSEENEPLSLQGLSDHVSSAISAARDQSPALPLLDSSDDAIVTNNMETSYAEKSTRGLDFHLHMRQEAVTTIRMQTTQRFPGEKVWHPEDLSKMNVLQQPTEPGCEQHEVVQQSVLHDQEQPYNTGNWELPGEQQQNEQKDVDLETTVKGDRLQQNVDLPGIEKNAGLLGCFGCSDSETHMDVEMVEQSVVVLLNSASSQDANVKSIDPSDLTLDNPLMEVETSKCNSEVLSNSISTQDLQFPESNVEMSRTDKEYDHCSLSLGHCGSCQPSVQSTEESCSSITAALKELHGLLVISNKPISENKFEELNCQSEIVGEGQTSFKDLSDRWTPNEHLTATQKEQYSQVSFHQTVSVSVKTEKLTDTSTGVGIEGVENSNFRGPGDELLADEEGNKESISESSSVTLASAKTTNQLHCTLGVEISPKLLVGEEDTLNQISEQTKALSNFILVKDLGHGTQDPVTDRPEAREDVCPEAAGPLLEFEPPTSHLSSPTVLPPLIFPATDIDRILRAGFTLQEALGALHQVGGNADLALLVLLAKNIVVPT